MDMFLGRTLEGRYLIEELIGVGGMANVYRGFDRIEHRQVAVKILRDEYVQNQEFLRRFRDESRAIYSLNHPNIVKIYDVILESQNPAIVMEYVDGITVKDYIQRKGVISIRIAVSLTMQLLRALQHAHDNGIVHRDIKPQNIMVPGDGSIKVMDFGIARFAMSQSRTITSHAIGSVHYTSPEQARGDVVIDHRSDIYSVGVILYEMLAGCLPFEGDNPVAVAMKQIEEQPVPLTQLNPNIPVGLWEIVQRAMAKHPDDRYQSADQMIYDFDRFIDNPQIVFGYRQRPATGYRREEATPMQNQPSRAREARPQEEPPRRRKKKRRVTFLSVLFGITCAFVVGSAAFVGYMFYKYDPFAVVPEVPCPQLVGQRYEEVIKNKAYKGFKFELVEQEYNPDYEQGVIYDQYPTSGKTVKEGITIKVRVSNGAQTATLPDFANTEATLVLAKLQEMGLVGEQSLVNSEDIPEGNVVSTTPGPNETVTAGSTVTVYVSRGSGKEKVQVPDVKGQDLETAREIIKSKGLEVGSVTKKMSDLPVGTVLTQSPDYPAPVALGSKVNLSIASDEEELAGGKQANILCMLPVDIEQPVKLQVEQDGSEILNQSVIPVDKRVVTINVPGESGSSTITVKINNQVYISYLVDFSGEKATYTETVNNSENFKP